MKKITMNTLTNNNFVAKLQVCVGGGRGIVGGLLLPALRFMVVNLSSGGKVSRVVWRGRVREGLIELACRRIPPVLSWIFC